MASIIYPPHCEEFSENTLPAVLHRRLTKLFSWLKDARVEKKDDDGGKAQVEKGVGLYEKYKPLLLKLSNDDFFSYPSKEIQLLTACSIAELIRLLNPDSPYKDLGQLEATLNFFICQLRYLDDTTSSLYSNYSYLLATLFAGKSFHLCFHLENHQEFLCSIFEVIFESINERHSMIVKDNMLEMLCDLVSQCDQVCRVSPELRSVVIKYVTEPLKSTKEDANKLAKELIATCWEQLQKYIYDFSMQDIADDVFVVNREEINNLIAELNLPLHPPIGLTDTLEEIVEYENAGEMFTNAVEIADEIIEEAEELIEVFEEENYLEDPLFSVNELEGFHSSLIPSPVAYSQEDEINPSVNIGGISTDDLTADFEIEDINEEETLEISCNSIEEVSSPVENEDALNILEIPSETIVNEECYKLNTSQNINSRKTPSPSPSQNRKSLPPRLAKQKHIQYYDSGVDVSVKKKSSIKIEIAILAPSQKIVNNSKPHHKKRKLETEENKGSDNNDGKILRFANPPKSVKMKQERKKASSNSVKTKPINKISLDRSWRQNWYPITLGYICNFCEKKCGNFTQLDIHIRCHTNETPFECEKWDCNRQFHAEGHMRRHQIMHNVEKAFACKFCPKLCARQDSLKIHVRRFHSNAKKLKCPQKNCTKMFTLKRALQLHLRNHLTKKTERTYKCDQCTSSFFRPIYLERHKLSHSDERPVKCDICQMAFKSKYVLKTHQLVHSGERPFVCKTCGKTFPRADNLKSHQLVHTKEKPFKCQICGKCFRRNKNLEEHINGMHTLEKPLRCDVCPARFARTKQLGEHKLLHKDPKALTCKTCGVTYTQLGILRDHERTHSTNAKCGNCGLKFKHFSYYQKHIQQHSDPDNPCVRKVTKSQSHKKGSLKEIKKEVERIKDVG